MDTKREEITQNPDYWSTLIQLQMRYIAHRYMLQNDMDEKALAKYLKVSRRFVSRLLKGDCDCSISKMFEICIAMEYMPKVSMIKNI